MDCPKRFLPLVFAPMILLAACASSDVTSNAGARPSSARSTTMAPLGATKYFAPTPYTAEQIRLSNPPGTKTVYRITTAGSATVVQTTWFVTDDGKATHLESETVDEAGNPVGEIERWAGPWTELRDHAKFPASHTVRKQGVVETEAGSYACHLYEVERDYQSAPAQNRFWFDVEAAGSPVVYEIEQEGAIVFRMELIEENRRRLEG